MAVTWDRTTGRCICGKRRTINVVIEFIKDGQMDYAGARLCYEHGTQICFAIPEDAVLTEVRIYDWHEPDELIKITASPVPEVSR